MKVCIERLLFFLHSMADCEDCKYDNCKSLERILEIFNIYHSWSEENITEKESSIIDKIKSSVESFSYRQLINDYNHIKHKSYHLSSSKCSKSSSSSQCRHLKRHKRDNVQNVKACYSTIDINDILFQKMLDQIHLFIYHPLNNSNKPNILRDNRFCSKIEQQPQTTTRFSQLQSNMNYHDDKHRMKRRFGQSTNLRRDKFTIQQCSLKGCPFDDFDSIPNHALEPQMFTDEDKEHIQNFHPSC